MSTHLQFLGATGTVTGSRFLVATAGARVLLDCGLFQGLRELRARNWEPFPLDPATIDAIVVSHAHLDHSGYLPALAAHGFRGRVLMTPATAALARIILLDSAHLLMEDTEHARSHGYSKHAHPVPLYDDDDVEAALRLVEEVPFDTTTRLAPGIDVRLARAGHILGSASVHVALREAGRSLLFSGDLGRPHHPLLAPPEPPGAADVVLVESTYGNRSHVAPGTSVLGDAIRRTVRRGGSVVIPAFAVDRTEVILMELRRLRSSGEIPDVPVYVDSPMALAALGVYREAIRAHSTEIRGEVIADPDVLDPGQVVELRSVEESKSINSPEWPSIIISASGMATGGRVLHHLAGLLPDPRNTVVLTGYQAEGTRGRDLADGASALKIHGCYVPVRAEVVDVPIFSVHADAGEIVDWLAQATSAPEVCYVVHGEEDAARALRSAIGNRLGWNAVVPRMSERVRLD
jgi:metallo-beta-lactamase family protein